MLVGELILIRGILLFCQIVNLPTVPAHKQQHNKLKMLLMQLLTLRNN